VALFSAFFPVGLLANISNSGTLFAFGAVSIAVMVIRRTDPLRHRPFRTPAINIVAPLSLIGCTYLFYKLDVKSQTLFFIWAVIGLVVYYTYSRSRSHVGLGLVEVHEDDPDTPPPPVPPLPGSPA
jgi:basic amino acid/polyamine antiporter, APA family